MRTVRLFAVSILVSLLFIQGAAQQQPNKALTNADVITMVKNGLPESVIVGAMQANDTDFGVSANDLLALKDAGVSQKIIEAMLTAQTNKKHAASTASAANPATAPQTGMSPAAAQQMLAAQAQAAQMSAMASQMMASQMAQMTPQQRAMMQSQLAGMGMMSNPGMGMMNPEPTAFGAMGMSLPPSQMPHCSLREGSQPKEIPASLTQISQTKGKPQGSGVSKGSMLRMFAGQAMTFAAMASGGGAMAMPAFGMMRGLSPMMMGGMGGGMPGMGMIPGMGGRPSMPTMTYVWALPGPRSANVIPSNSPRFELNYPDIVGIDPDEYEPALVHLVATKDNWRLVGATKSKGGAAKAIEAEIDEERVPVNLVKKERGKFELEPQKPLEPGEYGVVLRPVTGKKAAAQSSAGYQAQAQIFYSVWDFSFKSATPH